MSLKDQIQNDIKSALKSGDKKVLEVLRYLNAQIKDREISAGRKEMTNEDVVCLIEKQVKKLKDAIEMFKKSGRDDLVEKNEFEVETLGRYLPKQISDQELEVEVKKIVDQNPEIEIGPLIGKAVAQIGSKADNSRIAQAVKKLV